MLCKLFKSLLLISLLTVFLNLTGCGQSGPLYLPDKNEKDTKDVKTKEAPKNKVNTRKE